MSKPDTKTHHEWKQLNDKDAWITNVSLTQNYALLNPSNQTQNMTAIDIFFNDPKNTDISELSQLSLDAFEKLYIRSKTKERQRRIKQEAVKQRHDKLAEKKGFPLTEQEFIVDEAAINHTNDRDFFLLGVSMDDLKEYGISFEYISKEDIKSFDEFLKETVALKSKYIESLKLDEKPKAQNDLKAYKEGGAVADYRLYCNPIHYFQADSTTLLPYKKVLELARKVSENQPESITHRFAKNVKGFPQFNERLADKALCYPDVCGGNHINSDKFSSLSISMADLEKWYRITFTTTENSLGEIERYKYYYNGQEIVWDQVLKMASYDYCCNVLHKKLYQQKGVPTNHSIKIDDPYFAVNHTNDPDFFNTGVSMEEINDTYGYWFTIFWEGLGDSYIRYYSSTNKLVDYVKVILQLAIGIQRTRKARTQRGENILGDFSLILNPFENHTIDLTFRKTNVSMEELEPYGYTFVITKERDWTISYFNNSLKQPITITNLPEYDMGEDAKKREDKKREVKKREDEMLRLDRNGTFNLEQIESARKAMIDQNNSFRHQRLNVFKNDPLTYTIDWPAIENPIDYKNVAEAARLFGIIKALRVANNPVKIEFPLHNHTTDEVVFESKVDNIKTRIQFDTLSTIQQINEKANDGKVYGLSFALRFNSVKKEIQEPKNRFDYFMKKFRIRADSVSEKIENSIYYYQKVLVDDTYARLPIPYDDAQKKQFLEKVTSYNKKTKTIRDLEINNFFGVTDNEFIMYCNFPQYRNNTVLETVKAYKEAQGLTEKDVNALMHKRFQQVFNVWLKTKYPEYEAGDTDENGNITSYRSGSTDKKYSVLRDEFVTDNQGRFDKDFLKAVGKSKVLPEWKERNRIKEFDSFLAGISFPCVVFDREKKAVENMMTTIIAVKTSSKGKETYSYFRTKTGNNDTYIIPVDKPNTQSRKTPIDKDTVFESTNEKTKLSAPELAYVWQLFYANKKQKDWIKFVTQQGYTVDERGIEDPVVIRWKETNTLGVTTSHIVEGQELSQLYSKFDPVYSLQQVYVKSHKPLLQPTLVNHSLTEEDKKNEETIAAIISGQEGIEKYVAFKKSYETAENENRLIAYSDLIKKLDISQQLVAYITEITNNPVAPSFTVIDDQHPTIVHQDSKNSVSHMIKDYILLGCLCKNKKGCSSYNSGIFSPIPFSDTIGSKNYDTNKIINEIFRDQPTIAGFTAYLQGLKPSITYYRANSEYKYNNNIISEKSLRGWAAYYNRKVIENKKLLEELAQKITAYNRTTSGNDQNKQFLLEKNRAEITQILEKFDASEDNDTLSRARNIIGQERRVKPPPVQRPDQPPVQRADQPPVQRADQPPVQRAVQRADQPPVQRADQPKSLSVISASVMSKPELQSDPPSEPPSDPPSELQSEPQSEPQPDLQSEQTKKILYIIDFFRDNRRFRSFLDKVKKSGMDEGTMALLIDITNKHKAEIDSSEYAGQAVKGWGDAEIDQVYANIQ